MTLFRAKMIRAKVHIEVPWKNERQPGYGNWTPATLFVIVIVVIVAVVFVGVIVFVLVVVVVVVVTVAFEMILYGC